MKFINQLKNSKFTKIIISFLGVSLLLKIWTIFGGYYFLIGLTWRYFFIFFVPVVILGLLPTSLSFFQNLQQEMSIFEEGPANKSSFIVYLRKYNVFLFVLGLYSFWLAIWADFIEEFLTSCLLGLIAFISLILYLVQFVLYTNAYLKKSFKYNKSIFTYRKGQTRNIVTFSNLVKVAIVFIECAKVILTLLIVAELGYKFTHGGMNAISPWRQEWLNQTYPNDKTKIWTEAKAIAVGENKTNGIPYDSVEDTAIEASRKALKKLFAYARENS